MNQNTKDKENIIYNKIFELKNGNVNDKRIAFKCMGILGNESTEESLESRLEIVETIIKEYLEEDIFSNNKG